MKSVLFVVELNTYYDWQFDEHGDVEAMTEETNGPDVVGAYTSVQKCAEAIFTLVEEWKPDLEGDVDPIESVRVTLVKKNSPASMSLDSKAVPWASGDLQEIKAALREAYDNFIA